MNLSFNFIIKSASCTKIPNTFCTSIKLIVYMFKKSILIVTPNAVSFSGGDRICTSNLYIIQIYGKKNIRLHDHIIFLLKSNLYKPVCKIKLIV